jgi:cellulose synthase/poly-beta-1,6-N-acetylglucosamine synthase-like glycosyltransferase
MGILMEILRTTTFVIGILALLVTLPCTLEILLLTAGVLRRQRRSASLNRMECRLAIVIPAHNEASLIGRCVTSIASSAPSAGERQIVVVADNCVDETAARATEAGARVLVRLDPERRGKGYALRMAFDQLQAEGFDAFLVIDADSVVSENLVCQVVERLNAGASAVQCRYRVSNVAASLRTQLMDVAFLAFNVVRPRGRSGWGLSAGILGNGFAVRRDTLQKIPYNASSIVEDLEYHLRLVSSSERTDFIDDATVFGEIPVGERAARVQRSRWEGGRLRMAREWVPWLAKEVVRGQWRLTEPLLELLTLPLSFQVLFLSLMMVFPGAFRMYASLALGVIAAHVLLAAIIGGHPWKTLLALAVAPFYIVWKVTTLDALFSASRTNASWVRTGRDHEAGLEPVD